MAATDDRIPNGKGTDNEWIDFHQSESLVTRLANILDEYPPGVSTLREFVQNADDAGASRLVLCLDEGHDWSSGGALPTEGLAAYANGPALLVFNDATFTEKDFASISSIGKSRKREDTATIGKFGLGFNVVYHFTDVVQFVSGDSVVVFDPHGAHLPGGKLGLRANFCNGFGAKYPGLLDPLLGPARRFAADEAAGSGRGERLQSTLFRLPLRTEAQARS